MRIPFSLATLSLVALIGWGVANAAEDKTVLDHKVEAIDGKEVDLQEKYKGKALLIVNVASKCGYTRQYAGLEELNRKYKDKDFAVLGFPSNQFGKQEPGTNAEIHEFCKSTYDVTFDMYSKIDVNGESASPLYKELKEADAKPKGAGPVKWNFEKFVVDKNGNVIARFPSATEPDDPELIAAIEKAMAG